MVFMGTGRGGACQEGHSRQCSSHFLIAAGRDYNPYDHCDPTQSGLLGMPGPWRGDYVNARGRSEDVATEGGLSAAPCPP